MKVLAMSAPQVVSVKGKDFRPQTHQDRALPASTALGPALWLPIRGTFAHPARTVLAKMVSPSLVLMESIILRLNSGRVACAQSTTIATVELQPRCFAQLVMCARLAQHIRSCVRSESTHHLIQRPRMLR